MMFGLRALASRVGGGAAAVAPRFAAAAGTTARPRAAVGPSAAVAEPSLRWFSSTPVALAKKKQAQANDGPGSQIAKAKILRRRRLLRKRVTSPHPLSPHHARPRPHLPS